MLERARLVNCGLIGRAAGGRDQRRHGHPNFAGLVFWRRVIADSNGQTSLAPMTRLVVKMSGNRRSADTALVAFHVVLAQLVTMPFNQQSPAFGAPGALVVPVVHIPNVDVIQAGFSRDLMRLQQCLVRRAIPVGHPEIRMKGGKVQGHIGADAVHDPFAHPLQFVGGIIGIRNHQISDLKPYVTFVLQPLERVQDRLQMRIGNLLVEFFRKRLQVDIGGIHGMEERWPRCGADVTGRDCDRFDAHLPTGDSGIHGIFGPDDRIVVGEGHAATTHVPGCGRDRLGHRQFAESFHFARFGDVPVLAELAAQIAASCSE